MSGSSVVAGASQNHFENRCAVVDITRISFRLQGRARQVGDGALKVPHGAKDRSLASENSAKESSRTPVSLTTSRKLSAKYSFSSDYDTVFGVHIGPWTSPHDKGRHPTPKCRCCACMSQEQRVERSWVAQPRTQQEHTVMHISSSLEASRRHFVFLNCCSSRLWMAKCMF